MQNESYALDEFFERLVPWAGFAWIVFATLGFFVSGIVPVQSPSTSPEDFVAYLTEKKLWIQFGMECLLIGGTPAMMIWGIGLISQIRKYVNPSPFVFHFCNQVVLMTAFSGVLVGFLGVLMAFRIDRLDPATLQALYDLILFIFLISWSPFMIWQLMIGFAILSKTNDQALFPRWTGYFCIWAAILEIPDAFAVYWLSGPFSYNGAIAFWIPAVGFFNWVMIMSIMQLKRGKLVRQAPQIEPEERFRRAIQASGGAPARATVIGSSDNKSGMGVMS